MCAALKAAGIATWSVEYRRTGETGGGWPATFDDAAVGFEFVARLGERYALDLRRVITAGHSAGGALAFWIAGREANEGGTEIGLLGVVGLAGAVDLRLTIELAGDGVFAHDRDEVCRLMGGSPEEVPMRYAQANPGDLLPLRVPQYLVQGGDDDQIPPELPERWASLSRQSGSTAVVTSVPGAGHFDVVDPEAAAWGTVLQQIRAALQLGGLSTPVERA